MVTCEGGEGPCQVTACQPETGECATSATPGAGCDDNDPCTFSDKCTDIIGGCGGTAQICDDQNVCTTDACVDGDCQFVLNDGDVCTSGDTCVGDECQGSPVVCDDGNDCTVDSCGENGCEFNSVGGICDDGNACTIAEECIDGECVGFPKNCDDDNPCTENTCDTVVGCTNDPLSGPCSDGDACTGGDECADGQCVGGSPVLCPDGGPCQEVGCNPDQGCTLTNSGNGTPCDDGDPCTEGDGCEDGQCAGGTAVCECTTNADCDDGNPCNGVETCQGNTCTNPPDVQCDDTGDPCTFAECNPASGFCEIGEVNSGLSCGSDTLCEVDRVCNDGECTGTPIGCEKITCMVDTGCEPSSGCVYAPAPAGDPCDDTDQCTLGDSCDGQGNCSGAPNQCDDNNPCTADSCLPKSGCQHTPLSDGAACDVDGNLCTPDVCKEGGCSSQPPTECDDGVDCTVDKCDSSTGQCNFIPDPNQCNDNNPCTNDLCTENGCVNDLLPDLATCDDGAVATGPDFCFQGTCTGGHAASITPGFGLCLAQNIDAVGISVDGTDFYVAMNYTRKSFAFPVGCSDPSNAFTEVGVLDGTGLYTKLGSDSGVGRDLNGRLMVGDDGLVAEVVGDGVEFGGNAFEAVANAGGGEVDFAALGFVVTAPSVFLPIDNYLLAGNKGSSEPRAFLCTNGKGAWSCSESQLVGGSTNGLNLDAASLYSVLDCPAIPCIFSTVLGGGWLGGTRKNGDYNAYWDDGATQAFELFSADPADGTVGTRAVQRSDDQVLFLGTNGRLARCDAGAECKAVAGLPDQTNADFVDGVVYSGGVILLADVGDDARLYLLSPEGQATEPLDWTTQLIPGLGGARAIAGSVTTGLRVIGSVKTGDEVEGRWFFK